MALSVVHITRICRLNWTFYFLCKPVYFFAYAPRRELLFWMFFLLHFFYLFFVNIILLACLRRCAINVRWHECVMDNLGVCMCALRSKLNEKRNKKYAKIQSGLESRRVKLFTCWHMPWPRSIHSSGYLLFVDSLFYCHYLDWYLIKPLLFTMNYSLCDCYTDTSPGND